MVEHKELTLYLVEDKEMYAMMLDQRLKNSMINHNLQIFNSGEECLENIEDDQPDIVILDYLLPGIDGLETLRKIKSIDESIAVIVISVQQDIKVTRDVLKAGADDYIVKGKNTFEKLYHSIHKVIKRKELEDQAVTLQVQLNKNKIFMSVMIVVMIALLSFIVALIVNSP